MIKKTILEGSVCCLIYVLRCSCICIVIGIHKPGVTDTGEYGGRGINMVIIPCGGGDLIYEGYYYQRINAPPLMLIEFLHLPGDLDRDRPVKPQFVKNRAVK